MSRDVAAAEAVIHTMLHLENSLCDVDVDVDVDVDDVDTVLHPDVINEDGLRDGFTESTKVAGSCWSLVIPPPSEIIRGPDPSGMIAVLLVISPEHEHE